MDGTWRNYGSNMYMQTMDGAGVRCNSQLGNIGWNFKPLVHVNPKLVNYPYPFSNINKAPPPKKIHINPNFKHAYFPSADDSIQTKKKESSSVHINPHFRQSNINFSNDSKQSTSVSVLNRTTDREIKDKSELSSDCASQSSIQNETLISYRSKFHPVKNSSNSTYFWSKNGKPSTTRVLPAASTCNATPRVTARACTSHVPVSMTSIKTRHKIVKATSTNVCPGKCKYKFENPYRVINDKKSGSDSSEKSKVYDLVKKNVSQYSKTNVVVTDAKKDGNVNVVEGNRPAKKISTPNKTSYINRITNLIRTKYIYQNRTLLGKKQVRLLNKGKYKLDKRKRLANSKRSIKKTYGNKVLVSNNRSIQGGSKRIITNFKSVQWKSDITRRIPNSMIWRKSKTNSQIAKSYPNQSVINIGGIMYKSTSNKLTRTKDKKQALQCTKQYKSKTNVTGKTHHIVYVRGEKFSLGEDGKTLIRHLRRDNGSEVKPVVKRVDIGGVTYIQKSNNVLIQTKTHQARHFVNHAKQRSIALLSNLHKRSNMPCMIYHKFGICRRHNKGMCVHVHDPKNVALCKKFLKGECRDNLCLLSHNIIDEKIATCHFFLKGKCSRENCHFLHVKVNNKAAICMDFLQGFCALGQNCTKRHIHQCPDFEDKESCTRGVKCPYPHNKSSKKDEVGVGGESYKITKFKLTKKFVDKSSGAPVKTAQKPKKSKSQRKKSEGTKGRKRKMKKKVDECGDSIVECIPKRIKLNDLPLFIPLNS